MMTRGAWLSALAVGLGGWLSGAQAQQPVWRPIARAAPAATARAASPSPAELGRPIAVAPRAPAAMPPGLRAAPAVPPPVPHGAEPIGAVAPPGTVIAASAQYLAATAPPPKPLPPPAADDAERWHGDLFAADRPAGGELRPAGGFNEGQLIEGRPGVSSWREPWPAALTPGPAAPLVLGGDEVLYGGELPPPRWYVSAEYLLWWTRRDQAPPLATTGDPSAGVNAGFIGQPSTVILNDGRLDRNPRHGGRFFAGLFLDDCGSKAVEVGGFFLGTSAERSVLSSAQFPVLVRPFFAANPNLNTESGQRVAFPGVSTGRLIIDAPGELWGLEANLNCKVCCGCDWRLNALGGFRFLNLRESLTITEDIQNLPGGPDPFNGTRVVFQDRFATSNQFYGPQVGAEGRWQRGRWTVDGKAKLAMGLTRQTVEVSGFQRFPPGTIDPEANLRGGALLALNSNLGRATRERFAVVPEIGVSVGYLLTERLRASVGYNFLYWSSVVRPGDQIDRGVDLLRIPNFARPPGTVPAAVPRPARLFEDSGFWAQGLTFGLEYRY